MYNISQIHRCRCHHRRINIIFSVRENVLFIFHRGVSVCLFFSFALPVCYNIHTYIRMHTPRPTDVYTKQNGHRRSDENCAQAMSIQETHSMMYFRFNQSHKSDSCRVRSQSVCCKLEIHWLCVRYSAWKNSCFFFSVYLSRSRRSILWALCFRKCEVTKLLQRHSTAFE